MATKSKKTERETVVFVVDVSRFDISCGRVVGTPTIVETMVKYKHSARAVAVPTMLCHKTLESAKDSILTYLARRADSIRDLEYDPENFWVA